VGSWYCGVGLEKLVSKEWEVTTVTTYCLVDRLVGIDNILGTLFGWFGGHFEWQGEERMLDVFPKASCSLCEKRGSEMPGLSQ
jgi:hypothetical protein